MIFGSKIVYLEKTESTNLYAQERLSVQDIIEGTVFVAGEQTAGKGQEGNSWESAPGMNLIVSFVVYPTFLIAGRQFSFNKAISLGIKDFIEVLVPSKVTIKWPNDIYAGNGKIAGILIQNNIQGSRIMSTILGIGLNVNQEAFISDAPNPVSLKGITGVDYKLENILKGLCDYLDKRYEQLRAGRFREIDRQYIDSLYRFNEWAFYHFNGDIIKARITGISDFGLLQLQLENQETLSCGVKEIIFLSGREPNWVVKI
jgi:BirA family biotin operon repressor/biotin-[acetyl-CoA-carboxylase] ligase